MKIEDITKQYREEHGLSQREFAKRCGLSPAYIYYLESAVNPQTGRRINPSLPSLVKIAGAMNISLEDLMEKCDNTLVALSDRDDDKEVFYALFQRLTAVQKEAVLAVMQSFVDR